MQKSELVLNVYKVLGLTGAAFFVGVALTPILTHYLYKYQMWRKEARTNAAPDGSATPIFNKLHKDRETKVPRLGGMLIWGTTTIVALFFWGLGMITSNPLFTKLNFLSRGQTWVPLGILLGGAAIGFLDDVFVIFQKGSRGGGGGVTFTRRVALILVVALLGAYWFYFKLGAPYQTIFIPTVGLVNLGIWFIPFFMLTMLALFSTGVIDGLDGLAGGVLATIFSAYAGIAFFQGQIDLAAFCSVIAGSTLAFLWFNIPPARFYMSETGIMALTCTLTVVAFLTHAVAVLPIIAFPLFLDAFSVILQLSSKRFLHRKIFLVAPLHHHFEAMGWPPEKVTMRFWIISVVFALFGMILHLMSYA